VDVALPHVWIKRDSCAWPAHNYSDTQLPVLPIFAHFRAALDDVEAMHRRNLQRQWSVVHPHMELRGRHEEVAISLAREKRFESSRARLDAVPRFEAERASQAFRAGPRWQM